MILRKNYNHVNPNFSFGNNQNTDTKRHELTVSKENPSNFSRNTKMKRRQLSAGFEENNYSKQKMLNSKLLSKSKITTSATTTATYTGKERLKRNNCFPYKALSQYIRVKEKMNI